MYLQTSTNASLVKTTVMTMRCASILSDLSGVSASRDIPAAASKATAQVRRSIEAIDIA